MLLERLNPMLQDAEIIDRTPLTYEIDLQDTNAVMTELVRTLVYYNFKTVDSNATNWELEGELVKVGQENPYKMHVFINVGGADYILLKMVLQYLVCLTNSKNAS
ncbi:hypothetical protein [Calothrix sp. CCY 0018]|uniref:hypothetical protein n=1 Tax=Calothrix sp. CCY 0018 TaxID=3103864 RepID=UPI0039C5CC30